MLQCCDSDDFSQRTVRNENITMSKKENRIEFVQRNQALMLNNIEFEAGLRGPDLVKAGGWMARGGVGMGDGSVATAASLQASEPVHKRIILVTSPRGAGVLGTGNAMGMRHHCCHALNFACLDSFSPCASLRGGQNSQNRVSTVSWDRHATPIDYRLD